MTEEVNEDGSVSHKRTKGTHQWTKRAQYWSVRKVLDEDEISRQYLVDWHGVDPKTGLPWEPTWEPHWCLRGAKDVLDAWEDVKTLQILEGTREIYDPVLPQLENAPLDDAAGGTITPERFQSPSEGSLRTNFRG